MSGKSAFTEDQINDFQETFNLFDTKGDGKIPVSYHLIKFKLHVYFIEKISCSRNHAQIFQIISNPDSLQTNKVGEVLRALGQNPTEAEVHRLVHEHKGDRISFETFLPILQAVSSKKITDTPEDFVEGLRHFDKDGNGFITSAELRHMLTSLGEKMNEEDVENLIHGQEDSSGNINYEQFVKMVLAN